MYTSAPLPLSPYPVSSSLFSWSNFVQFVSFSLPPLRSDSQILSIQLQPTWLLSLPSPSPPYCCQRYQSKNICDHIDSLCKNSWSPPITYLSCTYTNGTQMSSDGITGPSHSAFRILISFSPSIQLPYPRHHNISFSFSNVSGLIIWAFYVIILRRHCALWNTSSQNGINLEMLTSILRLNGIELIFFSRA